MKTHIIATSLILITCNAVAGTPCMEKSREADTVVKALNTGANLLETLDRIDPAGENVYLVGRIGQDLSAYKQKYSHGGFVFKVDGAWQITHELNSCASDESSVYREGVANFYLDDLFSYESKLIAFKPEISVQLKQVLLNTPSKMHGNKYNMLAYPFSSKYQNSNGYLLETIMYAHAQSKGLQLNSREDVQSYLKALGYTPALVEVGMFKRLGARMTKANIAFDDQIFEQRMAGNIQTVTFDGIITFLDKSQISNGNLDLK